MLLDGRISLTDLTRLSLTLIMVHAAKRGVIIVLLKSGVCWQVNEALRAFLDSRTNCILLKRKDSM